MSLKFIIILSGIGVLALVSASIWLYAYINERIWIKKNRKKQEIKEQKAEEK